MPFGGKFKSIKAVACIFASALTVSEIVTFEIFDLEKAGHGRFAVASLDRKYQNL